MKIGIYALFLIVGVCLFLQTPSNSAVQNTVHFIELVDDTINPVTAEYIMDAIDQAYEHNAQALVIKLDTPGGLLSSTRSIVKHMLSAQIPIVVYIAPDGSRAGSAGVFITYASHIAAMAPSTNIGAAHPVQMGGGGKAPKKNDWEELKELLRDVVEDKKERKSFFKRKKEEGEEKAEKIEPDDDPMGSKILNDTVAFIKSIAKTRNRNIEWAIESVVKSASITAEEALEKGVVELIAANDRDLIEKIDGRVVTINDIEITLNTKDAYIERVGMDARQKFFNILANPNIAYFLMILGFYGLLFEVTHPGFGVPGIMGLIFLILAFYSMQMLPTNYAGLALLVLGLVLLVSEVYTPTFGLMTLGGLICMILGSMLLFESTDPIMRVSISAILAFSLTTAGITVFLLSSIVRSQRNKVQGGKEGLLGSVGEVERAIHFGKRGKVFVHGELWNAVADEQINKGEEIIINEVRGMLLKVSKNKKEE